MTKGSTLTINDLSAGLIDSQPALSIPENACTIAENVEFFSSPLGERRLGCVAIDLPTYVKDVEDIQAVTWMGAHLPNKDLGNQELWIIGQVLSDAANISAIARKKSTGWTQIIPDDQLFTSGNMGHRIAAISLHGKYFFAYKSFYDQLHVWDGINLRKTSMVVPIAPTVVDTAVAGSFATTRYYRARFVKMNGDIVLLRSEPGAVTTFIPNGSFNGAIVTRSAKPSQGETHWEVEASTDSANFYRIARVQVDIATYTDTAAFGSGYTFGTLSEPVTAYTPLPSAKFLSVDADRLILAGSWENPLYGSRVWWTPVLGNTGVGNDERLDMTVNPYIDLDGFSGGEITGITRGINGYMFVFKWSHIYKVSRSGNRASAYEATPLTTQRGAFPGSLIEATDEGGNPAQYFLDPQIGPMRIGINGLEWCGDSVRRLWDRVNKTAKVPAHGVFYKAKNQVHYWIAVDGAEYPNLKIILHCDNVVSTSQGAQHGWVTVPSTDRIANAHCSLMFSDNVDSTEPRNQDIVPFIGREKWYVGSVIQKNMVQRCDAGTVDASSGATDLDSYYHAKVRTKVFSPGTLLNKCGVLAGAIAVTTVNSAPNSLNISLVQDFGANIKAVEVNMGSNDGSQDVVVRTMDDLNINDIRTLQIEIGDLDPNVNPTTPWEIHRLDLKLTGGQTS